MITYEVKYNPPSSTHSIQMNKTVYFFIGYHSCSGNSIMCNRYERNIL